MALAALFAACAAPGAHLDLVDLRSDQEPAEHEPSNPAEPEAETADEGLDYEHLLDTGLMLRQPEDRWGAHLMFPFVIGFTEFELGDAPVDHLSTIAFVPTLELIIPIDERWTLLPFAGLGGAYQFGDEDLVGGQNFVGLARVGVQAFRFQSFAERYMFVLRTGARYDAALTSQDGVLGDWGNVDLGLELRRGFGDPSDEPRFEPGIYSQAFWYWRPIELDLIGVTPEPIDEQLELGISLGATSRWEILGIAIPRIYLGYRFGDGLSTVQIRFGRL